MAKREKKTKDEEAPKHPLGHPDRPPFKTEPATKANPSGITEVDPEYAQQIGQYTGAGGPGAAGCVVLGPVGFAATKGGAEPLPTANDDLPLNEGAEPHSGETATEGAREGENLGSSNPGADSPTETGNEPEEEQAAEQHNERLNEE